jgi:hypothetical protein
MTMKDKWTIGAVLAACLVLAMNLPLQGVDTRQIEDVRNKAVLEEEDRQIIDGFIAEAVNELVKTKDFTSVSRIRRDILASRSSQVQYAEQFSVSAYKHISEGLKAADELTPKENRFRVVLNLLILVDGLEDLRLADLAIERLNDESAVVRYWAVHALTNSSIKEQLNATGESGSQMVKRIIEGLRKIVEKSEPEAMERMARFAAEIGVAEGEELLLEIADVRIKGYAEWTEREPLLDATILELLCKKMIPGEAEPKVGRRFGQLYSYVIQRYIRGVSEKNFLSPEQKQQLESVLIETEQSCIQRLLDVPQSTIRKAVSSDDCKALWDEHNRLLGEEGRAGVLASKFNFDYGRNPDGSGRTAPLVLPSRSGAKMSE